MDSGLPAGLLPPPSAPLLSPSPPLLVQPPPEDEQRDDALFDLDRPVSRASSTNSNWNDIDELFPSSARGRAFLTPDYNPSSPRRPRSRSRMADSALAEANGSMASPMPIPGVGVGTPASPGPSPFNFQTQFMSTSPVKSVGAPVVGLFQRQQFQSKFRLTDHRHDRHPEHRPA